MVDDTQLLGTDRFSTLPLDVLKPIFDEAFGEDAWHQPNLPRRLHSLRRVARFTACILANPVLAQIVEFVIIAPKWKFGGSIENKLKREDYVDTNNISEDQLAALFDAIVNVQHLVAVGSTQVADVILAPNAPPTRFAKLDTLNLAAEFITVSDPLSAAHLAPLCRLPKLERLTIEVERDCTTVKKDKVIPSAPLALPALSSLTLRGPLAQCSDLYALLAAAPALTALDLEDTGKCKVATWTTDLLGKLPAPHKLTSLKINRAHATHPNDIFPALPALSALKILVVGGAGCILKPAFYDALHALPVEQLGFELDLRGVKTADLTKLVKGATKHAHLKMLLLDHIANDKDEGHFPTWTRSFSPKQLEKFMDVAEAEGIELEGTALWALNEEEVCNFNDLLRMIPMLKDRYRRRAIEFEEEYGPSRCDDILRF
ncbi:hypothetical protein JCM10207_003456 [Rhodosporidiobolus poonsookiae]